jgi:hemoglobin
MATDETLYDRLGGQDAVDAVVDEFYDRVLADEDLEPYFDGVDMEGLRDHQKEFVAYVTGGLDDYDGPNMADAHAHLGVTPEAFGRVAEHLDASLAECGVADDDRAEVMATVADLEDDVVSG